MPIPTHKVRHQTIQELAMKQLLVHSNDKLMSIIALMNRTYGRKATADALAEARKIMKMVDPNRPICQEILNFIKTNGQSFRNKKRWGY